MGCLLFNCIPDIHLCRTRPDIYLLPVLVMKRLIKNIILFAIPLGVLMFIADWFLSYQLQHSRYGEFGVWNDIYNSNIDADIAIYGSSRAMVHLDPLIIKDSLKMSAYNLGLNGHNFWLQYFRHKELLEYNRKPKFIIHSVDMFTLVKRSDLFQMEQFLPYMLYNKELQQWIGSYKGYSTYDFIIPLVRYYGQYKAIGKVFKSILEGNRINHSDRSLGFAAKDLPWTDDLVKARAQYPDYRVEVDSSSVELFENYLKECSNMGIAIALIYTPEYIEGQDFVKNRAEIMNIFSTLATKYGIPFIDYSDDPISYKKEYFYNASHLNGKGARLFTSKLANDIKSNEVLAQRLRYQKNQLIHQASLKNGRSKYLAN